MRLIPNINLTEEQVRSILAYNKVCIGGEATICESGQYNTLYKIFTDYGKPKAMGENKEKKIIELYNTPIDYSVRPVSTISLNDVIIGYEMTTDCNFDTYKLYQLKPEELIRFLKHTKEILDYFTSKGIVYGDLDPRNILFNRATGEVQFCDMDNIKFGRYPMDKLPSALADYESIRGIDDSVHAYMHNNMTLGALGLDAFWSTESALTKLFKGPAIKTVESMRNPKDFNGEYIISQIRK